MTVLYLVRHAHADYARSRPDEARPLSERGRRDAERVAGRLGGLPIAAVYASSARRARETVAPLAGRLGLPVQSVHALRERELAAGEVDDFQAAVRATWRDPEFVHPGGESNAAAQRRGVAAIRRILDLHPNDHVVAATHGNLLALIARHFDPALGYPFWQSLAMPDVYRLDLDGERLVGMERLWPDPPADADP